MKGKIFMYLFLFALLYIVFQYANVKKTFEVQQQMIADLNLEVDELEAEKDSIIQLNKNNQVEDFTLAGDEKARMYIEDLGYEVEEFKTLLQTKIVAENKADSDNKLVPYSGMNGFMRINGLKIINHKWVLVEFTDGKFWGEAILNYFIEKDGSISFEVNDGFLYGN
ncbi:hypothetical protein [Mesonia aestuariivivens]|uniref:Hydrolase n=1 Tax=Mesonia aestuariivivens TaxID=2796128 RepID=A0ABS6W4M8_9FLAO|nr:hypothetical protein [Mesonia aestuariivivens]MBW2962790.1 hypothetical protein [Mesonia aestuariivivens]